MSKPILNALNKLGHTKINEFEPYLMDNNLQSEKKFPGENLKCTEYNMEAFAKDNERVIDWLSKLNLRFNNWLQEKGKRPIQIVPTGSRSFGASYTESDLECAIVSNNFADFADFCRFLNELYGNEHNFVALKTRAGLPLLIVKQEKQHCFSCPLLSEIYPGKTLPHLEITFRNPNVHELILKAGDDFFNGLTDDEFKNYVFNKRRIELVQRHASQDATVDGVPLKKILEDFKGAIAEPLKCFPPGKLQETPDFNSTVFKEMVNPQPKLSQTGLSILQSFNPTQKELKPNNDYSHSARLTH